MLKKKKFRNQVSNRASKAHRLNLRHSWTGIGARSVVLRDLTLNPEKKAYVLR